MSFSFAKVWAADKDSLEEVEDIDQGDSWAQTLQKITEERDKVRMQEVVLSGRGVKRRAAAISKVRLIESCFRSASDKYFMFSPMPTEMTL